LYDQHRDSVYRYALRRVGPDAAPDIVSDVFLVAWRRFTEVPAVPLPWLYGVARRVIANQRRSAERLAQVAERLAAASLPAAAARCEPTAAESEIVSATAFAAAFQRLSDADREVLALIGWEGLSVRDAATVLGCGVSAATMRLHRARRRLHAALELQTEKES
jgi:RNA polymerase sigma-70 factor (ECF subfamily)